jgi:hypothetical protein
MYTALRTVELIEARRSYVVSLSCDRTDWTHGNSPQFIESTLTAPRSVRSRPDGLKHRTGSFNNSGVRDLVRTMVRTLKGDRHATS